MNFRQIMHVDTFELVASLREKMEWFDSIKIRQETQPQHKDTRTIYLRGPHSVVNAPDLWFKDVEHSDYSHLSFWPEAYTVLKLGCQFSTPMAKAMIVELKPGGSIGWHRDEGEYADKHDRYHLPLVTNPCCIMHSGPFSAHLPVGLLTYFNNHVPHSAVNFGDTPRYHLIVDFRKADAGNYSTS